jgi:hypothetical protein
MEGADLAKVLLNGGESLIMVLERLGYTLHGCPNGRKHILKDGCPVLINATAHETWQWLQRTGQTK